MSVRAKIGIDPTPERKRLTMADEDNGRTIYVVVAVKLKFDPDHPNLVDAEDVRDVFVEDCDYSFTPPEGFTKCDTEILGWADKCPI